MRKLALVTALATVALAGTAVAIGFGGGSSAPIKRAAESSYTLPTHRVDAPTTSGKAAHKVHKAKVRYFETRTFNLPVDGADGVTGRCPSHFKAINGYFGDNTGFVVPVLDSVGTTPRKWSIAVRNIDTQAAKVFLGFVCLKP